MLDKAMNTPATTVAGALAKIALAALTFEIDHTNSHGEVDESAMDLPEIGLLKAVGDLVRLGALPGKAVAS